LIVLQVKTTENLASPNYSYNKKQNL